MNIAATAIMIVLALLDVYTTREALKNPNLKEANPIIKAMMEHGNLWIVVKLGITAAALWWLQGAPLLISAIAAAYAYVVYNNAKHADLI